MGLTKVTYSMIDGAAVNVTDFGADNTGTVDSSAAIQSAFDSIDSGTVVLPAGSYLLDSDITLELKGGDTLSERFAIQATGAKFTGTGKFIIDSCKRLEINGLQMPTQNIVMRGCWWSQFNNLQFEQLIINDAAATSFNASYWNEFNNCLLQNITKSSAGTESANEFTFNSCGFRGNADHGFTTTYNYAFNFVGNTDAQSWKFFGGDVSYYNTGIYYIDAGNTSDVELFFNGIYFDTLLPQFTSRNKTIISTTNCKNAIGVGSANPFGYGTFSSNTASETQLLSATRSFVFNGAAPRNLIPGGDFQNNLGTWTGAHKPVTNPGASTVTGQSGGLNGNYINVNQAATTSNLVYFQSSVLPFSGRMTATVVIRNADVGAKTIRVGAFNLFDYINITNTDWSFFTITSETEIAAGTQPAIILYTSDGTAFNVDVAYVGIHYGVSAPVLAPSYNFGTIEYYNDTYNPGSIAAGSEEITTYTVNGAEVGDFVLVSTEYPDANFDKVVIKGRVSSTNTVSLSVINPTTGSLNLNTLVFNLRIIKKKLY